MPYKINSPTLFDLCSVGNIQHWATCTWPASLHYPSSGGTQATATREGPSTVDLEEILQMDKKQTALSAHNIQQYLPNHQFKHSRCFRQFRIEVMWNSKCPNRKRYTIENRGHYLTTNLRIIFPLFPIGLYTWRKKKKEEQEEEEEEKYQFSVLRTFS